jgi:predicted transcriptional regulator YheO
VLRLVGGALEHDRGKLVLLEELMEQMHQAEPGRGVVVHDLQDEVRVVRIHRRHHSSRQEAFL